MKKGLYIYSLCARISAIFMIIALLWLTISTPFVFASQQQAARYEKIAGDSNNIPLDEDSQNPYGNTTEEKAPSSTSVQEEFLHDHHTSEYYLLLASKHPKLKNSGTYIAFHGELHVPPPNAA